MPRKIVFSKELECFSVIMKMCICFFSLFALVTRKLLDKSDAHIIIEACIHIIFASHPFHALTFQLYQYFLFERVQRKEIKQY